MEWRLGVLLLRGTTCRPRCEVHCRSRLSCTVTQGTPPITHLQRGEGGEQAVQQAVRHLGHLGIGAVLHQVAHQHLQHVMVADQLRWGLALIGMAAGVGWRRV